MLASDSLLASVNWDNVKHTVVSGVVASQGERLLTEKITPSFFHMTHRAVALFDNQRLRFDHRVLDQFIELVHISFGCITVAKILWGIKLRLEIDALQEEVVVCLQLGDSTLLQTNFD